MGTIYSAKTIIENRKEITEGLILVFLRDKLTGFEEVILLVLEMQNFASFNNNIKQ